MGFIGSRLSAARADGFEFGFWLVDQSGEDVAPHGHEEAHVMWAMSGAYRTGAEGDSPEGAGILVYNPPGTYHADRFETLGATFFSVSIDPQICQAPEGDIRLPSAPVQISGELARAILRRMLRECGKDTSDSGLSGESLGHELLAAVADTKRAEKADKTPPRWLGRVCAMLKSEVHYSLSDLSREAGVHPTHLIRTFRTHLHSTPGEFGRSERVMRALRAMARPELPLSEIALSAGFADQSHMTNEFRKSLGVTPAVYRCRRAPAEKLCALTSCKTVLAAFANLRRDPVWAGNEEN